VILMAAGVIATAVGLVSTAAAAVLVAVAPPRKLRNDDWVTIGEVVQILRREGKMSRLLVDGGPKQCPAGIFDFAEYPQAPLTHNATNTGTNRRLRCLIIVDRYEVGVCDVVEINNSI